MSESSTTSTDTERDDGDGRRLFAEGTRFVGMLLEVDLSFDGGGVGRMQQLVGVVVEASFGGSGEGTPVSEQWQRWGSVLGALRDLVSTLASLVERFRRLVDTSEEAPDRLLTDEAFAQLRRDLDELRRSFPGWVEAYLDLDRLDASMRRLARDPEGRRAVWEAMEMAHDMLDEALDDLVAYLFEAETSEETETLDPEVLERVLTALDRILEEWIERWLMSHAIDDDGLRPDLHVSREES